MESPKIRIENERYTIQDSRGDGYILSVTYLNPKQETQGHQHPWEELYYIAYGIGELKIGRKKKRVSMGQFHNIPPDTFHQLKNNGMMTLAVVCSWRGK